MRTLAGRGEQGDGDRYQQQQQQQQQQEARVGDQPRGETFQSTVDTHPAKKLG